jgi:rare lipoprotein A
MQNALRLTDVVRRLFRLGPLGAVTLVLTGFGVLVTPGDGVAKTPGKTYCFGGVCHRVLTLAETRARVGKKTTAVTSYYDDCRSDRFNPCGLTSSGAVFRPDKADNAASPVYPNGTKLLVFNPRTGRAAVLRVNNAGPYKGRRTLDVSRGAAAKLGFRHAGVARLIVKVVKAPTRAEARYRARRTYAPVPGYIGRFDSIGAALAASGYGGGGPEPSKQQIEQVADLLWARYAAKATPVLPVLVEPEPAPIPEQPSLAFKQQLRKLAMAERRRQAIERQGRERARRVALAAAKAKQEAEEKRRVAAAARERQQVARKPATANPAAARQAVAAGPRQAGGGAAKAQRAATAQGQQSPSANAEGSTATSAAPAQPKRRTVWRREIIGVAQNSS